MLSRLSNRQFFWKKNCVWLLKKIMLRDTNWTSEAKMIAKQTAASSFINELIMYPDYFFADCVRSPKFSEVIFKKHTTWKFMQIMCNVIWVVVIRLLFSLVSLVQFITIRLGSLERDYSLFRGVITLEKGSRSQHDRYGCTIHLDRHDQ